MRISEKIALNLEMNLENLISSRLIPSADIVYTPSPCSFSNLLLGILEACLNLSLKYFNVSVSEMSGPSPPRF